MSAFLASLTLALVSLNENRVRSVLTTLGILIGIAAVVIVTALTTGARDDITQRIESLGSNLLFVFPRPVTKSGARSGAGRGLTERDAVALRREAAALSGVTVFSTSKLQVVSELGNATTDVVGADEHYFAVRAFSVASGRAWTVAEQQAKAKVCVIGVTVATKLFGSEDPVGRTVRIRRHPFLVIGTLAPKGNSGFEDQDDRILMPVGSWRARVTPQLGDRVGMLLATARSADHVDQAEREIEAILRQRHGFAAGEDVDFRIRTQAQFRESQELIFGVLTTLLLSVAGIALFVGGVGVMNIMLVSVTERTREIGIRLAIGAQRRDIQTQFLLEAIVLTLIGGLGGVLLAAGVTALLGQATGWTMRLNLEAVAVALVTSFAVGLVFGYLPARRAATLDPIEALRHE